jgi:hypothetical protein
MRYFEELDQLAVAFADQHAAPVIFDGAPSPMVFPSQALPPFPAIQLLVCEQDRPRLRQTLSACGFEMVPGAVSEQYTKSCTFRARDAATGATPLTLVIECQPVDDLDRLLGQAEQPNRSRAASALKAIFGAWSHSAGEPVAKAQLFLAALSPEETVLYLAVRSGRRQHERLFSLCSLLEFFRCNRGTIDWQKVADGAEARGLRRQTHAGLLMVNALLDQPVSEDDLARFECADTPPHVLQWARYGPASLVRFPEFKGLFFCLFGLASTPGLVPKLRYLAGASSSRAGSGAFATCAAHAFHLGVHLLGSALHGKRRYEARDLAYWIEPEPFGQAHLE